MKDAIEIAREIVDRWLRERLVLNRTSDLTPFLADIVAAIEKDRAERSPPLGRDGYRCQSCGRDLGHPAVGTAAICPGCVSTPPRAEEP